MDAARRPGSMTPGSCGAFFVGDAGMHFRRSFADKTGCFAAGLSQFQTFGMSIAFHSFSKGSQSVTN
jgi:hypothetical protein